MTYEHKPAMTFIGFSTSIRPEEKDGTDEIVSGMTLTGIL